MRKSKILSKYKYYFILICILIFSLFYTSKDFFSSYNKNETNFEVKLIKYKINDLYLSMELKGKENLVAKYYFKNEKEKKEFLKCVEIGDILLIHGILEEPSKNTVPNAFNYQKYLFNKNIYYILSVDNYKILKKNNNLFYKIKNYFYKKIEKLDNYKYLYAFILGEKSYIDDKIYNSYSINGVTHLFALSGLHTSLLSMFILFFLKNVSNKTLKYILTFLCLLLLCFIVGFSASILRSTIFFLLLNLFKIYSIKIDSIDILLITASILLIINPFFIYDLSFILSFMITYYILLNSKYYKGNYITKLFKVSFIAFLASIPIIINNFYQINILSIFFNLLFIPLVSFIIYPLSLISFIFPVFNNILSFFINVMENISLFFSKIDIFIISFSKVNIILIILYYIFLFLYSLNRKIKHLFCIILILILSNIIPFFKNDMLIYFCDVGQGDLALIITKNNKNIMIDTGGILNYKNENNKFSLMNETIIPFYKSIGIRKINYLILTHGDYDHMGEATNLVENFKVEKVIFNCGEFNELEQDLIKVLDKKKISYYSCIKELKIDDNKLYFLNNKDYGNENDNSSVIYTELNKHKFLFMGDAGVEVEEDLIEKYKLQDIDVLKVGHHGSKTSSGKEFINEINPKYSIISVGKNNRYGHPNKEVLNKFENSKIYRTDKHGSVVFKIKNDKLNIETCDP